MPEDERADEDEGGGGILPEAAAAATAVPADATAVPAAATAVPAAVASASVEEKSELAEWATWMLRGGHPVRSRKRGVKSVREEVLYLLLVPGYE